MAGHCLPRLICTRPPRLAEAVRGYWLQVVFHLGYVLVQLFKFFHWNIEEAVEPDRVAHRCRWWRWRRLRAVRCKCPPYSLPVSLATLAEV